MYQVINSAVGDVAILKTRIFKANYGDCSISQSKDAYSSPLPQVVFFIVHKSSLTVPKAYLANF